MNAPFEAWICQRVAGVEIYDSRNSSPGNCDAELCNWFAICWFMTSVGLPKGSAAAVQLAFAIDGQKLQCPKYSREFDPGDFTCPSLAEVREAAGAASSATHLTVSPVATQDIGAGHAAPVTNGALIQAASQFNCLEMTSDRVTTDQG